MRHLLLLITLLYTAVASAQLGDINTASRNLVNQGYELETLGDGWKSYRQEVQYREWDRMSDLEKTTTMYHELSHDILNAAHVNDETHLMHPTYQYESITELVLGLTKIFKEYKESNLKQFN